MITIKYSTDFGPGLPLAAQLAKVAGVVLNQGELDILFLTLASDATAWNVGAQKIERTIELTETPTYLAEIVGPGGDQTEKRKAPVRHLFDNKIGLQVSKTVAEAITLS